MSGGPVLQFPWPKPEFGNPDQIAALAAYQRQIIEAELEEQEGPELREFLVEVEWEGSTTVRVRARSAAEAKELAQEQVDYSGDLDNVNYTATEAPPEAPVNKFVRHVVIPPEAAVFF